MKKRSTFLPLVIAALLLFSCSAPQYFHDPSSRKRQKELRETRSANVVGDVFMGFTSVCMAAAFDGEVEFYPTEQQFKKLKLVNPTADTMYVNMLTDIYWDENNYCDFMDIRIPPKTDCKVMVPLAASYNLYFSPTPQSEDDEMLEIYTSSVKRISLKPGMTLLGENEK